MKLICERDVLHSALIHVVTRARNKLKIPILTHVKIVAADARLTLTATDLDTRSEAHFPAEIALPGATTVAAERLARLVDGWPQGAQVRLDLKDDELTVECGRSRYRLPTLPVEDFPLISEPDNCVEFTLKTADAKRLFGEPIVASVDTAGRIMLEGGHLAQFKPGEIAVTCTDGKRLTRLCLPSDASLSRSYILPKPAMAEMVKLASRGELSVQCSNNLVKVTAGNFTFYSKLIEADYPDLSRIIPGAKPNFILMDRAEFATALKRLTGLANDNSTINIEWQPGQSFVEIALTGDGSGSESVACECDVQAGLIAFAPNILMGMLDAVKGEMVQLHINGSSGAMRLADPDDPGLTVLAMPCQPRAAAPASEAA